eukprot:428220-Pelagomonas_calceolata.AAC.3
MHHSTRLHLLSRSSNFIPSAHSAPVDIYAGYQASQHMPSPVEPHINGVTKQIAHHMGGDT